MTATSRRWTRVLPFAFLALLALLLYSNSWRAPFVFDDVDAILENPNVLSLWPPARALGAPAGSGASGRPLVALSLAVNYALGGFDPAGYRIFNVAALVLCSWMLFLLVRGTLRAPGIAFAVAAIWIAHPLHTAAIDHVVYRNEILAALFLLTGLDCVRRAALHPDEKRWTVAAVLAAAAGMASKETAAALPILAFLYDVLFLTGSARESWAKRRTLHVALAATWIVLAGCIAAGDRGASVSERHADVSRLDYARTQLAVVAHDLRLVFWPHPLVLDYDWPIAHGWSAVALPALLVLGLLALTLGALARRNRLGYLGAVFFLVLAPSSSIVPLTGAVAAEHRMVLPLASVVVLVVLGFEALLRRAIASPKARRAAGTALVTAAVAALGATTWVRNRDYRTAVSIWADTARKAPHNPRAHGNLGAALLQEGKFAASIQPLEQALRLQPAFGAARSNLAQAHRRLGTQFATADRADSAVVHLRRSLQLEPQDLATQNALAWVLATTADPARRDPQAAVALASAVCRASGSAVPAEYLDTWAAAAAAAGDYETALNQARRAHEIAVGKGENDLARRIAARIASYAGLESAAKSSLNRRTAP